MIDFIGWLGAILFSLCAYPQVYKTWKDKDASSLSWAFLWLWFWGEILTFLYVVLQNTDTGVFQWSLLANYAVNFVCVVYLLWAKWKYKSLNVEVWSNEMLKRHQDFISDAENTLFGKKDV